MEIEWLKFWVEAEHREQFVAQDEQIWTAGLAKHPGFLGKETWISPDDLTEIILVIFWESHTAWQSVPQDVLQQLDRHFATAMGETAYKLLESKRYQKRRISTT